MLVIGKAVRKITKFGLQFTFWALRVRIGIGTLGLEIQQQDSAFKFSIGDRD